MQSLVAIAALVSVFALLAQCRTLDVGDEIEPASASSISPAWQVVYEVLQHPRCLNCHPAGDAPLQGDLSTQHAQNVQRGPDGKGLFAMKCATCHGTENRDGAHLPPGAPNWHLPTPDMPLVFEGKSPAELCRQLKDPAHNGGKTPEQILEHVAEDGLVLWGWNPGEGRAPVSISHERFVDAMRAWIADDCACP